MCSIIEGNYTVKRGKSFIDFMSKAGLPKDMLAKADGTTWHLELRKTAPKTWREVYSCDEIPEINKVRSMDEGDTFDNDAFGVSMKVTFTVTKEDTIKAVIKSDVFNNTIEHVFSDQGMVVTMETPKGDKHTETWTRVVKEAGYFRYIGHEGASKYTEGILGVPVDFDEMAKGAYQRWVDLGNDTWLFTERLLLQTKLMKVKLGEEGDYTIEGYERKSMATRIAPGKVKSILTDPKTGRVEEWIKEVDGRGYQTWHGYDPKTKLSCKHFYEPYSPIAGTWKPAHISGMEGIGLAMGLPADKAKKLDDDYEATLTVTETEDGYVHYKNNSSVFPYDTGYQLNEEVEVKIPGTDLTVKMIETVSGSTFTAVQKLPTATIVTVTKITDAFMIADMFVRGTNVRAKAVYTRV